ncbi:MAG: M1 family metallopeptidase [Chitinophagales bacterium]
MKFYPFILVFFLSVLTQPTKAQLISQKKEYTRADTLRGALRPERTCFDVTYYDLNIRIDTAEKTISGSNTVYFRAQNDFQTLQLDLFDNMKIVNVTAAGKELRYRREFNAVFVEMNDVVKQGTSGSLTVNYYGKPQIAKRAPWDGGFTWTKDNNGKLWMAVSCEGIGASLWWPCKDYLGDEPDSMRISCTIPSGLKCISNGNLESEKRHADGASTFNWLVSYPINTYNVTLNVGDYEHLHDEYTAADESTLSLDYYVMRYNMDKAKIQFDQVKPMLRCYEKYLGKYPFWNDGYALVETPYLGMEHQGAIAYGNKYLTGYAGSDYSRIGLTFDYIIIHESGHEWWGNSVSCKDIADMWIHESFCTYTESIYVECMYDSATAQKYINAKKPHVENKFPMVGKYDVNEEGDGDMYSKGALFLNTLRHALNKDELWWSIIKCMSDTAFKMKNIGYQDVVNYFSRQTGKDLSAVFEQYYKYPSIPTLEYGLKKLKKGEYELRYRWQTDVRNFNMPVYVSSDKVFNRRLEATNEFKTISIKLRKEADFQVNDDWMYINVKKVL